VLGIASIAALILNNVMRDYVANTATIRAARCAERIVQRRLRWSPATRDRSFVRQDKNGRVNLLLATSHPL
jgi:hypothetical protein